MHSRQFRSPAFTPVRLLLIAIMFFSCIIPSYAKDRDDDDAKENERSFFGTVVGIGLVAGGSVYSYYSHTKAREYYDDYRRSAFTDNTTDLHKMVHRHDTASIISAIAAGLGAFYIVVSF